MNITCNTKTAHPGASASAGHQVKLPSPNVGSCKSNTFRGFGNKPPSSKTGVKMTSRDSEQLSLLEYQNKALSIGWLSFTFPIPLLKDVVDRLSCFFGTSFVASGHGRNGYSHSAISPLNKAFFVCWSPSQTVDETPPEFQHLPLDIRSHWHRHSEGRPEGFVSVPQGVIDTLDATKLYLLMSAIKPFVLNVTRIDIYFDDYRKTLSAESIHLLAEEGFVSGFRKCRLVSEGYVGNKPGQTVYFGSRGKQGSGKYLRFYDKSVESKGEIDAYRMECEFSGEKAKAIWGELSNCLDECKSSRDREVAIETLATRLAGFLTGVIDFVYRKNGRLDRAERLGIWQRFLDLLNSPLLKIRSAIPVRTLRRSRDWIENQVAPTLAMLRQASLELTGSVVPYRLLMEGLLNDGRLRLNDTHRAILDSDSGTSIYPCVA